MSAKKIYEISYEQRKAAKWLLALLKSGVPMDSNFFTCQKWCIGDLKRVLKRATNTAKTKFHNNTAPDVAKALEALTDALRWSEARLLRSFDDIVDDHPCIADIIRKCAAWECGAVAPSSSDSRNYARIRHSLRKIFGVSREGAILYEFAYLIQIHSQIYHYFEDHVEIWKPSARKTLAGMLNISPPALRESLKYLTSFGLLETGRGHNRFSLKEGMTSLWDKGDLHDMTSLFCTPLTGQTLPLESFRISGEIVRHVEALLSKKHDSVDETPPVHIMLYGPPGTGKTTFARSLAKSLDVKAWSVSSREDDGDGDRRASMTACLNMAGKHPGSFVLVDEAERLLDTSWQSKDKAWLNRNSLSISHHAV